MRERQAGASASSLHSSMPPSLVSIVIPALNEAAGIAATLASIARQRPPFEVLVADGGSADGTPEAVARAMPLAQIVRAPRGRALQMNAGAAHASGEILLFLHADTHLPDGALDAVREALAPEDWALNTATPEASGAETAVGGCFRTRFDGPGADSRWMRLWESPVWMRWWRFAFGDRALFCSREAFGTTGGFRVQPLFEDLDFVRDLRAVGRFAFLPLAVRTSARRYGERGALVQQLRNFGLWAAWNAGIAPERLARFYPTHRPAPEASDLGPKTRSAPR